MEISPYLEAIQKITGRKPGEKYRTLNRIAQTIINDSKKSSKPIQFHDIEGLPEALVPLVKLETARITYDPEGVINALKSDDETVFQRAVKVKWFFDGSFQNYPSAGHFKEEIFPHVSVNHRTKLVKVLATVLASKQQKIAEDFYSVVKGMYGDKPARPLLKACGDTFIWDLVVKDNIKLNLDEIKCLYSKYPELIIKYLQLGIESFDKDSKDSHFNLYQYSCFFPTLIKKHLNFFVELIVKSNNNFNLSLNNRRASKFLKSVAESLLKHPELFMSILPLKQVSRKLTFDQFVIVLQKQFPEKLEDFEFDSMLQYLEYIPKDKKMQLMLSSFEKVYRTSLLKFPEKISWRALILLDPDERVNQARQKLATDKKWYTKDEGWDMVKSWRCYLPASESIPMIKKQITKTESAKRRMVLLQQMIMTCAINNDPIALLEVLKFVSTTHKNERAHVLTEFLSKLSNDFALESLSSEHWALLYDFIKYLHSKGAFSSNLQMFWKIIACRIHFDLKQNQPITQKIELLARIVEDTWWDRFTVFDETPEYEKICLNEFSTLIPTVFAKHQSENTYNWKRALIGFTKAIFEFNEFNLKAKNGIPKMSIKEHPWLLEAVKKFVFAVINKEDTYNLYEFMMSLKKNEPDLFGNLEIKMEINDKDDKNPEINLKKGVAILKRNPQEVLDDWERYYDTCQRDSHCKYTQRFLRCCRWYQDIPIKFLQENVRKVLEDKYRRSVPILAALLEGSEFETFVASHKSMPSLVKTESLRIVNPPVSLDNLLQVVGGETIDDIAIHAYNLRYRIAVDKLQSLSQDIIKRHRLVTKKYGIRILEAVSTVQEWQHQLVKLRKEGKHRSIRLVMANKIRKAFIEKPCAETWTMMDACIDGISVDDTDILELVAKIESVPNEYVLQYVTKLLIIFKKFGAASHNDDDHDDNNDSEHFDTWSYVKHLLDALTPQMAAEFPEEFHKEIFQDYLVTWPLPKKIIRAAQRYLVNCYLLATDDNDVWEHRTRVFQDVFDDTIKKLDEPDLEDKNYYPANYFLHEFIKSVIFEPPNSFKKWKLIETLLHLFWPNGVSPDISPEFFCYFSLAVHYKTSENGTTTPEEFADKVGNELCQLIKMFSAEIIPLVAKVSCHLIKLFFEDNPQLKIIKYLLRPSKRSFDDSLAVALLMCQDESRRNDEFWNIVRSCRKNRKMIISSTAHLIIDSVHD